ncbi:hypothetical protein CHCC20335_2366 [Bacillus paralicheniformis]|nr:hypothetical protein CHCC20335_2366 [Bacillus paralicheniformis]
MSFAFQGFLCACSSTGNIHFIFGFVNCIPYPLAVGNDEGAGYIK